MYVESVLLLLAEVLRLRDRLHGLQRLRDFLRVATSEGYMLAAVPVALLAGGPAPKLLHMGEHLLTVFGLPPSWLLIIFRAQPTTVITLI